MSEHGIEPIDMVVVNLYPFEETINREDVTLEEAIEQIDIGGPAMIRSAAKNARDVAVLVSPDAYAKVVSEMKETGALSTPREPALSRQAFRQRLDTTRLISALSLSETGRADRANFLALP